MAALIWLVVGLALLAAEVLSGDLVLAMLGVGALAAAGSAVFIPNIPLSVGVFAVASIGLLVLARPALKRRFLLGAGVRTNTDALVGARAVALSTVDADQGQVKLAGEVWSARSYIEGQVIESGTSVTVVEISGATAVVSSEP
ncbi:MAG: NfeD family protein [Pseudonocardiaceae bacterium]